ncbi:hypothetical protein [uncultured Psychroserpens sp.]|uniref:hypothetical protein n=1 Tax=uncultured Psychroserpens sp. TaxID=255436 RepID=UPI00261F139B|nr:hypothetical protein [uncultured Psychroserpens sp.]
MNKLTSLGVPINRLCAIVIFLLMSSISFAQEETYTTIRKNINPLAFDLNHNLSDSQDSLLLENKFLFKKVRFINKTTEKVFEFKPAVKSAKIPLDQLPLGKYTVMFYQADKIIVFQIDRKLPFDYVRASDTDVALNDIEDVELESEITSTDIDNTDLELDRANITLANSNADKDYETFEEKVTLAYNLTEPDRSKVQSRAEYRRTHLRPNGKPYND